MLTRTTKAIACLLALTILVGDADGRRRRRARRDRVVRLVAKAQAAFKAGHYVRVLEVLSRVPAGHRLEERARFLRAYAYYKRGNLDDAINELDTLLIQSPSEEEVTSKLLIEARLLRAMLAVEKQRWKEAQHLIDEVIAAAATHEPGRVVQTAERLKKRVDAELARLAEIERQREEKARREKRGRAFEAAIDEAKRLIEGRRFKSARATLRRAERTWPAQGLTRYYEGYLCYKRRRYRCAREKLRSALTVNASDQWARYMLALTIHEGGQTKRARALLGRLAGSSPNRNVRQVARRALDRIEASISAGQPRGGGLFVDLDLATGVDSNPAYLDETPAKDPAMALQVGARLGYRHRFSRSFEAALGAAVVERAYLVGSGDGAHHTEPRGWVTLALLGGRRDRLSVAGTYEYAFVMYGHSPLLSQHVGELALWVPLGAGWLDGGLAGWGGYRAVHDSTYNYFEAARGGAWARIKISTRRVTINAGYEVVRDWAGPVENTFAHLEITDNTHPSGTSPGKGGGKQNTVDEQVETIETLYQTDYTLLEHGPAIGVELCLPWRLKARVNATLRWRRFDHDDSVTEINVDAGTSTTDQIPARRDHRLSVSAELARALFAGLELALRFEQLNNWSTVESTGPNRTFSRTLGELAVRWRWQ